MIAKKEMRDEIKQVLEVMTKEMYEEKSSAIHNFLFQTDSWERATTIGVTISRFPEVSTIEIIEKAWEQKKRVAVPKCYPKDSSMRFFYLTSFSELETVYFGLQEPIENETFYCEKNSIDLMLVPGVVFDKRGYRIGHGGGYYDRYLQGFTGERVSLAFHEQLVASVPTENHDIPVEFIITDEGLYACTIK